MCGEQIDIQNRRLRENFLKWIERFFRCLYSLYILYSLSRRNFEQQINLIFNNKNQQTISFVLNPK